MELQTLLPLIPEIWATKQQNTFCAQEAEAVLAARKDVTPFGVTVPAQLRLGGL